MHGPRKDRRYHSGMRPTKSSPLPYALVLSASLVAMGPQAHAQVFSDNFNDNDPAPWWEVVDDMSSMSVQEVNGRVEFSTTSSGVPSSNHYIGLKARGWHILTDSDVRARIGFRFVKQSRANASARNGIGFLVSSAYAVPAANNLSEGLLVGIGQHLPPSQPSAVWREIDIGRVDGSGNTYEEYSFLASGNTFFYGSQPAFNLGTDGTLYVRYVRATDRLYFSLTSYLDPNAATIDNATGGVHEPLTLSIGGLSRLPGPQPGANSWLDNLSIDTGVVVHAPRGLTASNGASADGVKLEWTPGASIVRYDVFRGVGSPTQFVGSVGGNGADEFLDTTAVPGVSYSYRVDGVARDGSRIDGFDIDSGWRKLSAPGGVAASDGTSTTSVTVGWNPVPGATGYNLYRRLGTAAPVLLASDVAETAFVDTTALPLKPYSYTVRGRSAAGLGGPSAPNTGWRNRPGPATVTASDGTFASKVRVQWSAVPGATGYRVLRGLPFAEPPVPPQVIATLPAASLAFNDFTIPDGTPGTYQVVSRHARGWTLPDVADSGHRGLLFRLVPTTGPLDADGDGVVNAAELRAWMDRFLPSIDDPNAMPTEYAASEADWYDEPRRAE